MSDSTVRCKDTISLSTTYHCRKCIFNLSKRNRAIRWLKLVIFKHFKNKVKNKPLVNEQSSTPIEVDAL